MLIKLIATFIIGNLIIFSLNCDSSKNAKFNRAFDAVANLSQFVKLDPVPEGLNGSFNTYHAYEYVLKLRIEILEKEIKDINPQNEEERSVQIQLQDIHLCFLDIQEALEEFNEKGDKLGFVGSNESETLRSLSILYDFKPDEKHGFHEPTVLKAISLKAWIRADRILQENKYKR